MVPLFVGNDTDWQDDRPPAPSYLRVLYLGRMLQDDETLNSEFWPFSFCISLFPSLHPNKYPVNFEHHAALGLICTVNLTVQHILILIAMVNSCK